MKSISNGSENGYVNVNGINLYYERYGRGNRHKLLTLHGGPGFSHDYLSPLKDLVERNFDIVFYDQFGCGKSDYPENEEDYSLEYAASEVEGVRRALFGDSKVNLFGNSWGGMLALAYAIRHQEHLESLTSCSGLSSIPQTVSEMKRLISLLPEKYREYILKHEEREEYTHPEYVEGTRYFYRQHVLRMDQWPEDLMRSEEIADKRGTYLKMNGPSEFTIVGTIKNIDFTGDLEKITVPTLITCGRHDEVTPEIARTLHSGIRNSEMLVFQESSHLQFWEEREKYMNELEKFIKKND